MDSRRAVTIAMLILIVIAVSVMLKGTRSISSFNALTNDDREEAQQAIVDEAYAFYHRGLGFNYDDNNITYVNSFVPSALDADNPNYNASINHRVWKRRSAYFHQPEEAILTDKKYLVCSEFIVNVYYNAFANQDGNGLLFNYGDNELVWSTARFMKIANDENNSLHEMMVYYYNVEDKLAELKNAGCSGDECYNQLATEMQNIKSNMLNVDIMPGDTIVYRSRKKCDSITNCGSSTDGHIMLYVGKSSPNGELPTAKKDRYVLHSTGASYVYEDKYDSIINEANGTVQQITLDDALDYVLKSGVSTSSVSTEIAILRPLNIVLGSESYDVSTNTSARREVPDLVRTKEASVHKHDSINPGDAITYTITLENRSTERYTNIKITDTIPDNTTYVLCTPNCTYNNGNITWNNITVPANGTKKYSYTVRVNDNTPFGSEIVSDQTVVAGIKMNTIRTTVDKTLTKAMQNNLVNRVKNDLSGKSYPDNNSSFVFIVDAYDGVIDIDFGNSIQYVQTLLNKFYDVTNDDKYVLKNNITEDRYTKMYVKDLFGGYYTTSKRQYDLAINDGVLNSNQVVLFDGRELTYDNNTLMVGDVLLMYDTNYENESYAFRKYNSYLYLGYNANKDVIEFATINEDKEVTIVSSKLGSTNRSRLMESLFGQNAFIVLRPSYSAVDDILQLRGDVNVDGIVNMKDAMIVAKYIIDGNSNYDIIELLVGDMNNDGLLKMNDVIKILKICSYDVIF